MTHFETDTQYLIDTTKKLVECDSPVITTSASMSCFESLSPRRAMSQIDK